MIPLKSKPVSRAPKLAALVMAAVLMTWWGGGGGGTPVTTISASAGGAIGPLTTTPETTGLLATTLNTLPITVDAGPQPTASPSINVAYVSVTVCAPGTASTSYACQTIDHVVVDTGSSGLRLLKSALYSSLKLPQVLNSAGSAIGECEPFAIGTTWGSVRSADIYLGGELVSNASFQDIGDTPGGATGVPSDCSATGAIQGDSGNLTTDQEALGANGILGVGQLPNDCPPCLIQTPGYYVPAAYYNCNSGGCTNAQSVTSAQIVQNPVALLPVNPASTSNALDNNGVLIDFSGVTGSGSATTGYTTPITTGSLILGIGTESNNKPGTGQYEYDADIYGNLQTTYTDSNGGTAVAMFGVLDSGSNALYFPDSTIVQCSSPIGPPWYCPSTPTYTLPLRAFNQSVSGSEQVSFTLVGLQELANNAIAANIGAYSDSQSEPNSAQPLFDWGLPFFFGRQVYTGIAGAAAPSGVSTDGAANGYWTY